MYSKSTGVPLKTNELSLSEMGFSSPSDQVNWHGIKQPQKNDLIQLLLNMIKNYQHTNIQIIINDTTFNCHMIVLKCYSDFFKNLTNVEQVILPADKVTAEAFAIIYEWMLAEKPIVQRDGILELYNAAQYLKIKELIHQCWFCLDDVDAFCEDSAFLLYLEARKFDHDILQKIMLTRISKFFLTLVASKDFLELTNNEICNLLKSNTIGVNSETDVTFFKM